MFRTSTMAVAALATALTGARAGATPTPPDSLVNPLFSPSDCEFCHDFVNAVPALGDLPYSPFRTWQGSMMANAARDPVFWAGLAVADVDGGDETELCVRCHAPRAFLEGNGLAKSMDDLTADQRDGVECELCHRAVEDLATPPGNAQYEIDDVVVGTNVPRRGPWDYSDGVPLPPHAFLYDTYIGSSRLCGTCHDVTTTAERVDDAGVGLGVPFNEQRTYREWLGSVYAQPGPDFASCQDCHMPAVVDMPGCAQHVNQFGHPTGGRRHDLVGANRFMIELLREEYGSTGANVIGDLYFETAIDAMTELLSTATTVALAGPESVDLTVGLNALDVTVTNETGHKLPTGYSEGRIMWLQVEATYADTVVWTSGAWDAAGGLQRDPQLRTYEAVAEQWSSGTTFHLLLNDHWVVDSRIPPRGLTPDPETDPVGDRYTLQPDGTWPNFDSHSYAFAPAPELFDVTPDDPDDDELLVTVRVQYLINTPEYIDFLASTGSPAGVNVATMFDLAGGATPVTVGEATLAIPIVGFGSVAGTGGSSSGGDDTTGGVTSGASTGTVDGTGVATTMPPASTTAGDDDGSSSGPGADGDDGGCSCRGGGRAPGALALGLLGLAFGPGRRRRRRHRV